MRKISLFVLVGTLICLCTACGSKPTNVEQNPSVPNNDEIVQNENNNSDENVNNEVVNPDENNKPSEGEINETKPETQKPETQKPENKEEKPVENKPAELPEQKPSEETSDCCADAGTSKCNCSSGEKSTCACGKKGETQDYDTKEEKPSCSCSSKKNETSDCGTSTCSCSKAGTSTCSCSKGDTSSDCCAKEEPKSILPDLVTFLYDDSKVEVNARFEQEIPADQSFSYIGLSEEEYNKYIEESIVSESMMMPANYSLCIVKVKAGEDITTVKESIFNNANARKWICMSAENVMVINSDNCIMLVMSTKDNCDSLCNSFTKYFDNNVGGKLERAGE